VRGGQQDQKVVRNNRDARRKEWGTSNPYPGVLIMVTCYPKEFCDTHDIVDKTFFTGHEYDAKKDRDTLARQLRKDGYTVETKKYRFDTRDSYTIHAIRLKPVDQSLSNAETKEEW
jgi:hypothetical protein